MTDLVLTANDVSAILAGLANDLTAHAEELRQLDALAGDGDLGMTAQLAGKALAGGAGSSVTQDIGRLLMTCGMNINSASPSTFGTLLATAFMGGGKVLVGKETVAVKDLGMVGDAAVEAVKKRGKSEAGNKTLLDSLIPACNAFKSELTAGGNEEQALKAAVKAAEEGMKATINMPAKYGRVSWRPDHGVGIQDGGATAMFYIIESCVKYLLVFIAKNK